MHEKINSLLLLHHIMYIRFIYFPPIAKSLYGKYTLYEAHNLYAKKNTYNFFFFYIKNIIRTKTKKLSCDTFHPLGLLQTQVMFTLIRVAHGEEATLKNLNVCFEHIV